jgi:predicted anti-sigma-YlaC factor YlaD
MMKCDQYRESASARLDGEDRTVADAALDAHLAGCPECAGWYAAAQRVSGLVRAARAEPVPDLSTAVLAAMPPARGREERGRDRVRSGELLVRAGIALLAVGQLLLAAPALAGHDELAHSLHSAHETGAWNLALAVAFGWDSLRPRHAAGLLPLLAAFAAVLTVTSIPDLQAGRVPPDRVATHALVWCAAALVAALTRLRRQPEQPEPPAGGVDRRPAPGHAGTPTASPA